MYIYSMWFTTYIGSKAHRHDTDFHASICSYKSAVQIWPKKNQLYRMMLFWYFEIWMSELKALGFMNMQKYIDSWYSQDGQKFMTLWRFCNMIFIWFQLYFINVFKSLLTSTAAGYKWRIFSGKSVFFDPNYFHRAFSYPD